MNLQGSHTGRGGEEDIPPIFQDNLFQHAPSGTPEANLREPKAKTFWVGGYSKPSLGSNVLHMIDSFPTLTKNLM